MCGIHGIISRSDPEEEIYDNLSQMGKLQRHRGPDAHKNEVYRFRDLCVGFGFERLSILDLQTGMQPIKCEIDNSVIICNGQVYNYLELKHMVSSEPFVSKGDIEVALHLYRKKGISFLDFLNGMYGGAIYDPV
ncbi:MAG TPA: asparagine synthetase B, partial [Desulfobacteraceae bacterium]|nr:asparagine synthetase B [Desulfobacteraceae bacterium]